MKFLQSLVVFLGAVSAACGQSVTFEPATITAEPRDEVQFVTEPTEGAVLLKVDGGLVKWSWDKDVFQERRLPLPPSIQAQLLAPTLSVKKNAKPGTYKIYATTAKIVGGSAVAAPIAMLTVIVQGPTQPDAPKEVVTVHPDALTRSIYAAFKDDGKPAGVVKLAAIFRKPEPTIAKARDMEHLIEVVRIAADELSGDGMKRLRTIIESELRIDTAGKTFDRAEVAQLFDRIRAALETCK